jgi:uncharacterized membrane protein YozB (DUF420 family)
MNGTLSPGRSLGRPWIALLLIALLGSVVFIALAAVPYFLRPEVEVAGRDPRRAVLLVHIALGTVALLLGPFQLWLGFHRPRDPRHRRLGLVYAGCIAVSCVAAYLLAFTTRVSFTFGFGLAGLATAWLTTTGMGLWMVKRREFLQHQEWMIRSYVVTFAFVTFRFLERVLDRLELGSPGERVDVASWFCWAVPLLVCEVILQARKCRARSA